MLTAPEEIADKLRSHRRGVQQTVVQILSFPVRTSSRNAGTYNGRLRSNCCVICCRSAVWRECHLLWYTDPYSVPLAHPVWQYIPDPEAGHPSVA